MVKTSRFHYPPLLNLSNLMRMASIVILKELSTITKELVSTESQMFLQYYQEAVVMMAVKIVAPLHEQMNPNMVTLPAKDVLQI